MLNFTINLDAIEDLKNCKFKKPRNSKSINNSYIENNLFRLLIENKMNRFLFGYITRLENLDVNFLSIYDVLLEPNRLKEICGESCIKKFTCPKCGHLLFRKHLHEIGNENPFEVTCPNCSKQNIFKYVDLEDEFELKRIDLIKFLERLVDIDILSKKLVSSCNFCTASEVVSSDELVCLSCECGNLREIKFKFVSNYDFLTQSDGYWFEWYVYMLCNHIYGKVFQNYSCEFEVNGEKYLCELDVLTISEDNKLIIYECKDHMYHLKDNLSLKDFADNIVRIRHFADKIYVVSSLKNVKTFFKEEIPEIIESEIEFIEGMDLENKFLNEDSIITFFENQNYNSVSLYAKLPDIKKRTIMKRIVELIIKNENGDYLNIINSIFNRLYLEDIVFPDDGLLKESLNAPIYNISNNIFVVDSLTYINNLYHRKSNIFDEDFDLNNFLRLCTPFLTSDPFDGFKKRAPFYYFISSYLRRIELNFEQLNREIIQQFLFKFASMISVYYGNSSLKDILAIFKKLWVFKTEDIENELVNELITEYFNRPGYKQTLIRDFLIEMYDDFSQNNKILIKSKLLVSD